MPRRPKPFLYRGWYCTNAGGAPQQKLCKEEEGYKKAELALARLLVQRADAQQEAKLDVPGPGIKADLPPVLVTQVGAPELLIGPKAKTVAEVHDEFLDMKKVEKDEDTYIHYRDKLSAFFQWFGVRPIRSLTLQDGLEYKKWLMHDKPWKKGKRLIHGLGSCSVNHYIRAAKILLNWCCKPSRRYLDYNPWEEIGYLKEQPHERIMTDDEFRSLLAQCTDGNVSGGAADFREQLVVLRHTTMRPGELRKLQWDYIQWEKHKIVFPATVIKTKSRRPVTMLSVVEETLLARKKRLEEAGLKAAGYVFTAPGQDEQGRRTAGKGDQPVRANSFSQRFRRLVDRCVELGLIEKEKVGESLVLYTSRHTRITELVAAGLPMKVVMDEAGHKVHATTNRYTHLADDFITEQVRRQADRRADERAG